MRKITLSMYAMAAIACFNTSALFANGVVSVSYVPPGLSPGDTYQIAFVTSGTRDALEASIAAYDAFVQAQAVLPGAITESWGVGWSAIAATISDPDGQLNSGISGPVYRIDGTLIALDQLDMWDADLVNSISVDQYGQFRDIDVWTGMEWGGSTLGLGLGVQNAWVGISTSSTFWWAQNKIEPNNRLNAIYAVSEVITVIPEPTTLGTWLMLTGFGAIGSFARRKRVRPSVPSQV